MRRSLIYICFVAVLLFTLILPRQSTAIPRFSVEYGQSCQLCHHNPNGGGMRSLYGAQFFSYTDLALTRLEDLGKLEKITPKIGENFQFGADFRTLYYSRWKDVEDNSFLTMQGDLYLAITPSDNTLIYLEKGLGSAFETYALLHGLPGKLAIKAGRFIPSYGWRFADHKSYVRDYLGFSQFPELGPRLTEDSGIEGGFHHLNWDWTLALTNGVSGFIDADEGKALTTRGSFRWALGETNLTLGGCYRYAQVGLANPVKRYAGGFWGLNWRGFTAIGETDLVVNDPAENRTAMATTNIIGYEVHNGFDLNLAYDFLDTDIDKKSGSRTRYKLFSEIYITGYLELVPSVEWHTIETSNTTTEYGSGELQLHLWF